jgi:hypothetical protein
MAGIYILEPIGASARYSKKKNEIKREMDE